MKRYIITINAFEGLEIKRFDGYFQAPFVTRIAVDKNGFLPTRTACRLQFLLKDMVKTGKAYRVTPRPAPNTAKWVIDVEGGVPADSTTLTPTVECRP